MGPQEGWRATIIKARAFHQLLEKQRHGTGIEPSLIEDLQADTIGFAFMLTGVIQLLLDGAGLGGYHRAARQLRVGSRRQQRKRHGGERLPCILTLLGHHTRQVALHHVANFVRQHAGQFGLAGRGLDQASVYPDDAAWQGESVDAVVAHDKEGKALLVVRTVRGQAITKILQIIDDLDIVDHLTAGRNITQDFFTNALLFLRRHHRLRNFAQIGQVIGQGDRHEKAQQGEVNDFHPAMIAFQF